MTRMSDCRNSSQSAAILAAVNQSLRRETHVLRIRPDLLWQQLRARLLWEADPWPTLIAAEQRRRIRHPRSNWFAIAVPPVESGSLVQTLVGHSAPVSAFATDDQGNIIVSGDHRGEIRAWDLKSNASRVLGEHSARVNACVLGPRHDYAAAMSEDGAVGVWPLKELTASKMVRAGVGAANDFSVSPDGSYVAVACSDGTVTIIPVGDSHVMAMRGHSGGANACNIAPNGQFVVSASMDRTLRIWDPEKGVTEVVLTGHDAAVLKCAVSPDSKSVASIDDRGTVMIWEVTTGQCLERVVVGGEVPPIDSKCTPSEYWIPSGAISISDEVDRLLQTGLAIEFDPSGMFLAAVSATSIVVWDFADRRLSFRWQRAVEGASDLAIAPNGQLVASACSSSHIRIWNTVTGDELEALEGHSGAVRACRFSGDGSLLVSASDDMTLKLWDPNKMAAASAASRQHNGPVHGCALGADGTRAVSAGDDHTLAMWETTTGEPQATLAGHIRPVRSCAVDQLDRYLVSGSDDGTVRIWNATDGRSLAVLAGHTDSVRSVAIARDGSWAVSASDDQTLRVWDLETAQARFVLRGHNRRVRCCAIGGFPHKDASQTREFIVSGSDDATLRVWNPNTGETQAILHGHTGVIRYCTVSPSGDLIASAAWDETVRIWSTSGSELAVLPVTGHIPRACVFTSDGAMVVAVGDFQTLRAWDTATGALLLTLQGHTGVVRTCTVGFDGLVISGGDDHWVRVWDLALGREVASLPLPGAATSLAAHPTRPLVMVGEAGGNIVIAELVRVKQELPQEPRLRD